MFFKKTTDLHFSILNLWLKQLAVVLYCIVLYCTVLSVLRESINAQLPRFNSKFASPGCSGVDALAQDWRDENNWICPPVSAIVPSLRALSSCSCYGILIIPQWPSAYFWPFLRDRPSQFKSFVKEVLELPCIETPLVGGSWPKANLQGAFLGLQRLPENQNVSFAGRF